MYKFRNPQYFFTIMFLLSSVRPVDTWRSAEREVTKGAPLVYKLTKVYGGKIISLYCIMFIYY